MDIPPRIARILRLVSRSPRSRPARPGRGTSLILERLEDRCVTAVLAGPNTAFLPAPMWDSPVDQAPTDASSTADTVTPTPTLPGSDVSQAAPDWPVPDFPDQVWESGFGTNAPPLAFDTGLPTDTPGSGGPSDTDVSPGTTGDPVVSGGFTSVEGFRRDEGHRPVTPACRPGDDAVVESATPSNKDPGGTPPSANPDGVRILTAGDVTALPRLSVAQGSAGPANSLAALSPAFQITRTPVSDTGVEVRYSLTSHSRAGSVSREQFTVIPAGAAQVEVSQDATPAANGNGSEIVTLTLLDHADYQISQPSGTLFLAGSARECSEAALLAAYKEAQSPEAFSALVERNRSAVMRTCHRILGNWHDAEDVSQLVFLALAQGPVRLPSTLAGWLRTVARNAAIVLLRARNRRYRHEQRASKPVLVVSEDSTHDLREELDMALTQVTAPLRDAVRLRYLEGWSQLEAAAHLGCPRGTLSQRAALGIRRLREILEHRNGDL